MNEAYNGIVSAVRNTLKEGYRTKDIMQIGAIEVSTSKMGDIISKNIF